MTIYFGSTGRRQTIITLDGEQDRSYFGVSLAVADLNKDGFDDLIVGSPRYTDPAKSPEWEHGKVYVFAGGATFNTIPAHVIIGNSVPPYYAGEQLGEVLASVGDTNGDGYPDIAISATLYGADRSGAVYILYGSNQIGTYRSVIRGIDSYDSYFGTDIAGAGDNTGDGFNDIWVSINKASRKGVYLIKGGVIPQLDQTRFYAGGPVLASVDFDGDGYTDPTVTDWVNSISVYSGAPTGAAIPLAVFSPGSERIFQAKDIDGDGRGEIVGDGARIYFGHNGLPRTPYIGLPINMEIMGIGDVNGDGIQEAILTANEKVYLASLNPFQGLPKITIAPGIDNSIITAPNITITGTISRSPTLLIVGGDETPIGANGNFSANVPLREGKNFIEVIAKGTDGRIVKRYLAVSAVTTPLEVTITSPSNGATLTTNPVTVQGTVSEETSQILVNGTAATVNGTSWSAVISLANGQQTINATATDSYSRSTSTSIAVTFSNQHRQRVPHRL